MKKMMRLLVMLAVCVFALYPALASATVTYAVTTKHRGNMGDQAIVIAQLDLSGTYVTNGFTLTPKDFGLSTINQVIIPDYAGYSFAWDRANGKVKVYSGNADYTPAGSVSTVGVTVTVAAGTVVDTIGFDGSGVLVSNTGGTFNAAMSSAPTFTGVASAAGVSEEVDNGTSLAAVNTIELVVMGR